MLRQEFFLWYPYVVWTFHFARKSSMNTQATCAYASSTAHTYGIREAAASHNIRSPHTYIAGNTRGKSLCGSLICRAHGPALEPKRGPLCFLHTSSPIAKPERLYQMDMNMQLSTEHDRHSVGHKHGASIVTMLTKTTRGHPEINGWQVQRVSSCEIPRASAVLQHVEHFMSSSHGRGSDRRRD